MIFSRSTSAALSDSKVALYGVESALSIFRCVHSLIIQTFLSLLNRTLVLYAKTDSIGKDAAYFTALVKNRSSVAST